eukprot:scaffold20966_cov103-Skeletonema_menzelii.AAC.1
MEISGCVAYVTFEQQSDADNALLRLNLIMNNGASNNMMYRNVSRPCPCQLVYKEYHGRSN